MPDEARGALAAARIRIEEPPWPASSVATGSKPSSSRAAPWYRTRAAAMINLDLSRELAALAAL